MPSTEITEKSWPQNRVHSVETRKRDLVIRIANWIKDKDEPAYDVEVYVSGVYDWNLSQTFGLNCPKRTKQQAKEAAMEFAAKQIKLCLK